MLKLTISLLAFIVLFAVSFYPAGLWLVERVSDKFHDHEKIILAFLSSTTIFTVLAVILGIVDLRFLMLPLTILINLYSILSLKRKLLTPWKSFLKDKKLVLIILAAIIVQGIINFPSGHLFKSGLMFWSSQGNDGLWHVAVMEEVKKNMPLDNPIYAGENLYNYHYLSDIIMGEFGRIYPVFTSLDLYFRFFPVVLSFFISLSVFSFVARWRKSKAAGYWAIFFTSLCGNFGFIVTLIKNNQLFGGETIFWAAQGNTIIGNPPHAIAYALLATCFLLTTIYLRERKLKYLVLAFVVGATAAGYKVSGGFVLAVGIAAAALADFIINKKKTMLIFAAAIGLSNLAVLKLMSKAAGSFLVWQPWWFIRTTIVDSGRVGWLDMEYRRQHYVSKHTLKATLRIIQLEAEAFLIFIVGNLGTRIIGLFSIFEKGKKGISGFLKDTVNIMMVGSMLSGLIMVLLFVQKGIAYNLIQFFQYTILIFGFFAAAATSVLISRTKSKLAKWIIGVLIIAVSLPTVIGNVLEFYGEGRLPLAKIGNSELKGLSYLKDKTEEDALVLTIPFSRDAHWSYKTQPWPISVWYSTAYVSAIASRRTYFANEGQVDILGIPVDERRNEVVKFFSTQDIIYQKEFLKNNKIDYIYLFKPEIPAKFTAKFNSKQLGVHKLYENNEVIIYRSR
jgi:hypothetical protein